MHKLALTDLMEETFAEALESLGFVSPLPPEGPAVAPADPMVVRLASADRVSWFAELAAGEAFGRLLARNILAAGPDEAISAAQAVDALKELMNVSCGVLLSRLMDRGAADTLRMGLPQIRPLHGTREWEEFLAASFCRAFDAEGCIIAVRVGGPTFEAIARSASLDEHKSATPRGDSQQKVKHENTPR